MEGAGEKKVPAVPETLKKVEECRRAKDRVPEEEVCPKDAWKDEEEAYV